MKSSLLSLTLLAAAVPAFGQVTLFGQPEFRGRSITITEPMRNLERADFANRASSAIVRGGPYEFCSDRGFAGECVVVPPGRYPTLDQIGLNNSVVSIRRAPVAAQGPAEITLFGRPGFEGRSFATREPVGNLGRYDFNDRASSVIVSGGRFEVCDERGFEGNCMILRPGQYPSLSEIGMEDAISSVRPVARQAQVDELRFAPPPPVAYDYRRRPEERLYEAEVVAVRAVYGRPEQRCWVDREEVSGGDRNVPGAVIGGIIGGILGHQVGSGRGNDAATAGGAIAGAMIGSNTGSGGTTFTRDVQRCAPTQTSGRPEFFDVRYRFRGAERTVQMAQAPGPTITVNGNGEPRAVLQ